MLTMPEINCIKLMRNQKSLSINQISKALGINWRTAKKYADADQLPVENQLISDWYEQKSLIITSNLEFSQWNRVFSDARLTAALVDRVIHHAHIVNFTGDSFRITNALSRQ